MCDFLPLTCYEMLFFGVAISAAAEGLAPPLRPSASAVRLSAGISALAEADQTAAEAQELQSILEAREKCQ